MTIIGFGHVSRVGKTTGSQALVRDLGFREISFAQPLKDLALLANPLVVTQPKTINTNTGAGHLAHVVQGLGSWETAKDQYLEVRPFLQRLGDGCRQVFGDSFWVDQALAQVKPGEHVVFPDVRYESEADAIHELGGLVFRINRPGHTPAGHVSETELADWTGWDHTFDNNGNVADLERAVVTYVKGLLK